MTVIAIDVGSVDACPLEALTEVIGKHFKVGDVLCCGVEICKRCLHLQGMTRPGLIKDMVHRGGLRGDTLTDGSIAVGDRVVECAP